MKKLLMLSAVLLTASAVPAFADSHGGKHHKGKMFEKHDTNGDGVISKDEFLGHAQERFSKMDADGNGEVSKEEAKAAHEKMREKFQERREERKERQSGE